MTVSTFSGLLIDFAQNNANAILRGLRAVTDFEYEFQMTGMNRRMKPEIETVFLMASEKNQFIASSMVKEIANLDGDISSLFLKLLAINSKTLRPKLDITDISLKNNRMQKAFSRLHRIGCVVSPWGLHSNVSWGRLAQLVEQVTFNHWVTGSNPVPLTIFKNP